MRTNFKFFVKQKICLTEKTIALQFFKKNFRIHPHPCFAQLSNSFQRNGILRWKADIKMKVLKFFLAHITQKVLKLFLLNRQKWDEF